MSTETTAGLPETGTVVSWANMHSRLRMEVQRESVKDGAEINQAIKDNRNHQRWKLNVVGQDNDDVIYTIENVRSGKVLEIAGAHKTAGVRAAQRSYESDDAHHQQWKLIPVESEGSHPVYEIVNRNSSLSLRIDANTRAAIMQDGTEGEPRNRQWQLHPV
ncbi:RICIN domain-containing protein [Streptomyces umbrinus]|uniref:RICIN domain-containing protein n=1 Tax=Streptomyces umbrinus TaxID=67370 RepID=UPI0033CF2220